MQNIARYLALLAAGACASSLVHAAQPSASAAVDPAAVAAFIDREVPELLRHSWVPGATVSVVQGDRVVFTKGYGIADVATGERVDGARTLFRVGSITKTMTTAAALVLYERGELNLDADINRYLTTVTMPARFPEPVTARRLMTHHGGFDTNLENLTMPTDAQTILSPEARQRAFVRVRPVSAPIIYDNLGFGVLGTVVADIAKTTYREAMRRLIFGPLNMKTAVIGLPTDRLADAASCHRPDSRGRPTVCPQELIADITQGGGDASVTAADMAQFMRMLLIPGKLLQPATLAMMKDTDAQRLHPLLPGSGLGIREADYAGRRTVGHHGTIGGFVSEFALFPQTRLGVFISVNGDEAPAGPRMASTFYGAGVATGAIDARPLVEEFVSRFADAFVPPGAGSPVIGDAPLRASERGEAHEMPAAELAGDYSRPDATIVKTRNNSAAIVHVGLTAGGLDAYGCAPFVRRAAMYYECRPAFGPVITQGFTRDAAGRVLLGHIAIEALERTPSKP